MLLATPSCNGTKKVPLPQTPPPLFQIFLTSEIQLVNLSEYVANCQMNVVNWYTLSEKCRILSEKCRKLSESVKRSKKMFSTQNLSGKRCHPLQSSPRRFRCQKNLKFNTYCPKTFEHLGKCRNLTETVENQVAKILEVSW